MLPIAKPSRASFESAVDAVACALALHRALDGDGELNLRIGIHSGDVIAKKRGVVGDAVNTSARLMCAVPNGHGILIDHNTYAMAAKANISAFSYRYFSRKAGFKSPNFLKLVIDGQRSLGPESVDRFAKALKLDEDEHDFFRALVAFEQARTPDEKNEAFARVAASQRFRQARRLDSGMFTYLSRWYYPAIREMAHTTPRPSSNSGAHRPISTTAGRRR